MNEYGMLWNRRARLQITKRSQLGMAIAKNFTEDFRISFIGEKNAEGNINTMEVTLWNPAPSTVASALRKDGYVLLDVAYGKEAYANLFQGDIVDAHFDPSAPDSKLVIKIGDGKVPNEVKMTKTWNPGIDFGAIAKDIAGEIQRVGGVMVEEFANLFTTDAAKAKAQSIAERGYSVQGLALKKLVELGNARGLDVSIQDSKLIVALPNGYDGEVIYATPESGLIGSPTKVLDEKTKQFYYELKMLISTTRLRPHRLIKIEAEGIRALIVIRSVKFDGDTRGSNWYATVQGVAV